MAFQILRLKRAVERTHRCHAEHAGSRVIVEHLPDGTIWRGRIEVFDLSDHPQADRCYAWIEQRGTRTVAFIRLRVAPVKSAQTAVRSVLATRPLENRVTARRGDRVLT